MGGVAWRCRQWCGQAETVVAGVAAVVCGIRHLAAGRAAR